MSENFKSSTFVFTLHNYSDETVEAIKAIPCKAIIAGFELGEKGETKHIQGAISFGKKQMRAGALMNALKTHCFPQKMKGDWSDQSYCFKEGNLIRMEDNRVQGQREDLIGFRESLKRGADDVELLENNLREFAKFPRLVHMAREAYTKKKSREFRKVEVIVMWGPAGVGKTRKAYEEDAYVFDDYEDGWWNGYSGEKTILIDEFYGGIKYSKLLKLLDGYQHRLKIKGGFTYAQWTRVYITSNKPPCEWYKGGLTDALKRRITKVMTWHYDDWLDDTDNELNK